MSETPVHGNGQENFPLEAERDSVTLFEDLHFWAEYRLSQAVDKNTNNVGIVWATYATDSETLRKIAWFNLGLGQDVGGNNQDLWRIGMPLEQPVSAPSPEFSTHELTAAVLNGAPPESESSFILARDLSDPNREDIRLTLRNVATLARDTNGDELFAVSLLNKLAASRKYFVYPIRVLEDEY